MLWERVFKSWATKIRYRKPCPSLIALNQTLGSFQGKMNFPECAIPDIQPCRCSCKGKVPPYWLNRHCNALISETTPCVIPLREYQKFAKRYFLSTFDFSLHARFSSGGGSVQCTFQGHTINGFIELFWHGVPPGNLLVSRTANPARSQRVKK